MLNEVTLMKKTTCQKCGGSGNVRCMGCSGQGGMKPKSGEVGMWSACAGCSGKGQIRCAGCNGSGSKQVNN